MGRANKVAIIVILSLSLVVAYAVGVITAGPLSLFYPSVCGVPLATVKITNQSKLKIKEIVLQHSSGGFKSTMKFDPIPTGDSNIVRFYLEGEADYKIQVQFEDGRKIEGGNGYIEGGYKTRQIISDSAITELKQLFSFDFLVSLIKMSQIKSNRNKKCPESLWVNPGLVKTARSQWHAAV